MIKELGPDKLKGAQAGMQDPSGGGLPEEFIVSAAHSALQVLPAHVRPMYLQALHASVRGQVMQISDGGNAREAAGARGVLYTQRKPAATGPMSTQPLLSTHVQMELLERDAFHRAHSKRDAEDAELAVLKREAELKRARAEGPSGDSVLQQMRREWR